jgi:hypothetical protein
MILKSKKGTVAVFLMTILASVLLLVIFFINAAAQAAGRSYADAVLDLAGRSVLSEFDLQLQKRYGLFAFHADEAGTETKIKYYADYSFHDNMLKEIVRSKAHMDLLKLDVQSVHVNLKGFAITDTDLFEEQIAAYMKYAFMKDDPKQYSGDMPAQENIVLRNQQIINTLPSKGYNSNPFGNLENLIKNGLPDLNEIKETSANTYLINEYIINHFLNRRSHRTTRNTFFQNEVEYILKGGYRDQDNYKAVRRDLFILRNVMNLMHINTDSEKRRKVEAVAAAMTLAEGKEIASVVVAEAWAAAETENDLRLLEDGKLVPLIKKKENWAVPISDTLEYLFKKDYLEPTELKGYDYEDYLKILLYLENREKKLLRCMDLIQINMKGWYSEDFDLREYYGGFRFTAIVKEREYTFIEKF